MRCPWAAALHQGAATRDPWAVARRLVSLGGEVDKRLAGWLLEIAQREEAIGWSRATLEEGSSRDLGPGALEAKYEARIADAEHEQQVLLRSIARIGRRLSGPRTRDTDLAAEKEAKALYDESAFFSVLPGMISKEARAELAKEEEAAKAVPSSRAASTGNGAATPAQAPAQAVPPKLRAPGQDLPGSRADTGPPSGRLTPPEFGG